MLRLAQRTKETKIPTLVSLHTSAGGSGKIQAKEVKGMTN
jgi:hypothetical protein